MASSESFISEALTLVWLLLIATTVATYFIQRYRVTLIPPSTAAMCMGIICGGVVKLAGLEEGLKFSPSAFFYGLLPPIVFAAGFTLKKREFFRNFGTISLFATVGTLISTLIFGFSVFFFYAVGIVREKHLGSSPFLDCMLFGSLISATDPVATLAVFSELEVPPLLYNLVFGESVLNDAVAVLLFRTISEFYTSSMKWSTLPLMIWRFLFIGVGSVLIGIGVALACAFVLKRFQLTAGIDSEEHNSGIGFNGQIYEMTIIIMSAYLAYLVAEVLQLSGIVALFFTAICHAHYSFYSVNRESQVALRAFFEFAAFLSETFVFIYLGLQVARLTSTTLDWGLLITGIPLCLLARVANIFPLAYLLNKGRKLPLPPNLQAMMVACGLRGAIAFGLAMQLPQAEGSPQDGSSAIVSATLIIVVFSTIAFGGATGPLLSALELKGASDTEVAAMGFMARDPGVSPQAALQLARAAQETSAGTFYNDFKSIDRKFLKPLFGGRSSGRPLHSDEDAGLLSGHESECDEIEGHGSYSAPHQGGFSPADGGYEIAQEMQPPPEFRPGL